VDGQED